MPYGLAIPAIPASPAKRREWQPGRAFLQYDSS
jgi:hypothetical protein